MCSSLLGNSMNNLQHSEYYKEVVVPERDLRENKDMVRNRKHSKEPLPIQNQPLFLKSWISWMFPHYGNSCILYFLFLSYIVTSFYLLQIFSKVNYTHKGLPNNVFDNKAGVKSSVIFWCPGRGPSILLLVEYGRFRVCSRVTHRIHDFKEQQSHE